MRLFDDLKEKFSAPKSGGRFINKYGLVFDKKNNEWIVCFPTDLTGFVNYKAEQLFIVTEYLKQRNTDIL